MYESMSEFEKYFVQVGPNKYERRPPDGSVYRIFRREIAKKPEDGDAIYDYEYGVGEFFIEDGKIVSYDDLLPILRNHTDVSKLVLEINRLYREALKNPIMVIQEDENGFIIRRETALERKKRVLARNREKKPKIERQEINE